MMSNTSIERVSIQTKSLERNYTTKAPDIINGTSLQGLNWLTSYTDPRRFTSTAEIEALFHEISKHKDVSGIVIKPGAPICLRIKQIGLKAITHRIVDKGECESIIKILTLNNSIMSILRVGKTVSGLTKIAMATSIDSNTEVRYRYEITASTTPQGEASFTMILMRIPASSL